MTALGRLAYGRTCPVPTHARRRANPVPGDAILHPLALMSLALLMVNDHLFKPLWPGLISGKLSDFAGLVYFPLFLTGLWEVAISRSRADWRPGSRSLFAAVVVTGLLFAGIKTLPSVADAYATVIGTLQSFVGLLAAALTGRPAQAPVHLALAMDTSDLVALPALVVSWLTGLHRASDGRTSAELPVGTRLDDDAITRRHSGTAFKPVRP